MRLKLPGSPTNGLAIIRPTMYFGSSVSSLAVSQMLYSSSSGTNSVLQIAAHEDVVPLDELYSICETARELTLDPKYMVGRIIARPFVGEPS